MNINVILSTLASNFVFVGMLRGLLDFVTPAQELS